MKNGKWKRWHKITLGVLAGILLLAIIAINTAPPEENNTTVNVLSKQDSADLHKKKIEDQFSVFDGSHTKLKEYTKDQLNDPGSFEHLKTVYWDRDSVIAVKMEYTAKNGFGGRVRGTILAECDMDGNILKIIASE